ncbi:hypothetical protein AGDE_13985 [Angomonas deanei]|uniref:Uncharacterized protein n=1 Tax=Angomonas deanei TaxID=59799 RepID=A0A7G2CDP2_9TRYP|nr:hypothetical protein AGDE_13985 [Angomonas deanei]CAD2217619.1 hypothetical protein, conserved [Angomonas deanei]|eukprot:EPY21578.1 hypothetical protein AGDE_13985 [Angomonas deanei]
MFRDRVLYNICIDDVYENNFNLGRHLSKGKADWFKLQFLLAADRCASVDERLEELITEVHPFAEATVKTDLYRCLIESPLGTSTVGLVRATLMIMNPYTSAFTLKHRLSDLWVQPQQTLSDIALLKRYQRNIDYPSDQEALAAAGWTATSDSVETEADGTVFDAFEISLTKKSETGNHKRHSIANEEELTALRARYDAALESALCSPESGCLLDEEDLGENSIVRRCLYCVDHRGFSTYYHRARFVRHLVALAQLMDHQKDGKNKKNQYFYIKATLPRREILRKRIMESILADERYVVPGTHTGTALLQSYVGSRGAEEKVRRVKQMGDRRSGGGHAKPVVRHDLSRPQRDVLCDECGRKRNCFPSTDPKVDRGVYCFECWQNYTK